MYKEVEVDVDLSDFETDDLIEELESRGVSSTEYSTDVLRAIHEKRRLGQDYQTELEQLIWLGLGKFI